MSVPPLQRAMTLAGTNLSPLNIKLIAKGLLQSFNGSNILGTMKMCSRYGLFEPLRLIAPCQEANGDNLGKSFRSSTQ